MFFAIKLEIYLKKINQNSLRLKYFFKYHRNRWKIEKTVWKKINKWKVVSKRLSERRKRHPQNTLLYFFIIILSFNTHNHWSINRYILLCSHIQSRHKKIIIIGFISEVFERFNIFISTLKKYWIHQKKQAQLGKSAQQKQCSAFLPHFLISFLLIFFPHIFLLLVGFESSRGSWRSLFLYSSKYRSILIKSEYKILF